MNEKVPLLFFENRDDPIFYFADGVVTAETFSRDVESASELLEDYDAIFNLCGNRYLFSVIFSASLSKGKTNLLPPSLSKESLKELYDSTSNVLCIYDDSSIKLNFPAKLISIADFTQRRHRSSNSPVAPLSVLSNHKAITIYTSGSTGDPVPYQKTWGSLIRNANSAIKELGIDGQLVNIVGTVPVQHMYGFESMILLCLIGRCPLWFGRPFYPVDIAAALSLMPAPRMLVTTPLHLESMIESGLDFPDISLILSATAPLDLGLAKMAENMFDAPVYEIYGCTETGQIASKRTVQSDYWKLFPDIHLTAIHDQPNQYQADGGHIESPTVLGDLIDFSLQSPRFFRLLGRISDHVNIAGKRSSLSFLTAQLKRIPGVDDGVFFLPQQRLNNRVSRLCGLYVSKHLSAEQILSELRQRIDPLFLPRPLIQCENLPYNDYGKLPYKGLQSRLDAHLLYSRKEPVSWEISPNHEVFDGHFRDSPLVPGAMLLDWVIETIAWILGRHISDLSVKQVNFHKPVFPGACLMLNFEYQKESLMFAIFVKQSKVVSGRLAFK